jgi:uncharacterized CHY-type Zn-finger protein
MAIFTVVPMKTVKVTEAFECYRCSSIVSSEHSSHGWGIDKADIKITCPTCNQSYMKKYASTDKEVCVKFIPKVDAASMYGVSTKNINQK